MNVMTCGQLEGRADDILTAFLPVELQRNAGTHQQLLPQQPTLSARLTWVRSRQPLGFGLSHFSTPLVGFLVRVKLQEEHRVDPQRDHAANWGQKAHSVTSDCLWTDGRSSSRTVEGESSVWIKRGHLGSWRAPSGWWLKERSAKSPGWKNEELVRLFQKWYPRKTMRETRQRQVFLQKQMFPQMYLSLYCSFKSGMITEGCLTQTSCMGTKFPGRIKERRAWPDFGLFF